MEEKYPTYTRNQVKWAIDVIRARERMGYPAASLANGDPLEIFCAIVPACVCNCFMKELLDWAEARTQIQLESPPEEWMRLGAKERELRDELARYHERVDGLGKVNPNFQLRVVDGFERDSKFYLAESAITNLWRGFYRGNIFNNIKFQGTDS